jgi:pimeloyl-ACP methyl ester carboxylesterase
MSTPVLIFVPGTLGSELWDGNEDKVWPGTALEAITGFSSARFDQLRKPNLIPKDIVRAAAGGLIGIYRSWIEAFEAITPGGGETLFREKASASRPQTLFVFPYDWRVDLISTAGKLADFLDERIECMSDAELNLVCHSLGGVVARYYLESGLFKQRPAFSRIALLVTFGTPHNGAAVAYAGAVGLHKTSFLSVAQTQLLANDARYPSLYQLFPPQTQSFIWAQEPKDAFKSFPPDDPALVQAFQLTASSLNAWTVFRKGLTGDRPQHVRYFYIVGSRQSTLVRLRWDTKRLVKEELDDAGDGTVPLLGSIDTSTQTQFVGKSHVNLIETLPARATLAALFGATTLFAEATVVSVTARDTVIGTTDPVHVLIEFTPSTKQFKGRLTFQKAKDLPSGNEAASATTFVDFSAITPIPIELNGAQFTHITLIVSPIDIRGIYRPVLEDISAKNRIIGPAFAVQLPAGTP